MRHAKRAFTLIELIISIMIIALIVTYLYQSLGVLKKSNEMLASRDTTRQNEDKIKKLFLLDILQSTTLTIRKSEDRNFDLLEMETLNSLHNIKKPKVTYLITKREKKLIRIEGVAYELPLNRDTVYGVKFDEVMENITHFKLYLNQKKNRVLINIKEKGKPLSVFEVLMI